MAWAGWYEEGASRWDVGTGGRDVDLFRLHVNDSWTNGRALDGSGSKVDSPQYVSPQYAGTLRSATIMDGLKETP